MRSLKKQSYIILLFVFLFFLYTYSNIILERYFSELLVDQQNPYNWQLELEGDYYQRLDGWYLTSLKDTARLKDSLSIDFGVFTVITLDSLLDSLAIYASGDRIALYDSFGNQREVLVFGNQPNPYISAPKPGQSLSREPRTTGLDWYLDNSPTIGQVNDFEDASGWVDGYIFDDSGNTLDSAEIQYGWYDYFQEKFLPQIAVTDSNGFFKFQQLAKIVYLEIRKKGYISEDTLLQVWPDSTVSIQISLIDTVIDNIDEEDDEIADSYKLNQNYPNPFNNQTIIQFTLPLSDFAELTIYDMTGKIIATLVSGYMKAGNHSINWNADNVASGIYIYQLKTSEGSQSKKCLLLK